MSIWKNEGKYDRECQEFKNVLVCFCIGHVLTCTNNQSHTKCKT